MKRLAFTLFAIIILLTALLPSAAFADVPDLSGRTDSEVYEILNSIRNEIVSRDLIRHEDIVLIDQNDVQVYLTGNYEIEEYYSGEIAIELEAVVINNSDKKIGVRPDAASINGWEVDYSGISDISAGKKKKDDIELRISDAGISSFEEIEDIELTMLVYDGDDYMTLFVTHPVSFFLNELPESDGEAPAQEIVSVSESDFNEIRYLTLQPSFFEEGTTQESLDAEAGEDYISAILNDDGSVTYEMNGQQYVNLLGQIIQMFNSIEWMGVEIDESID